MAYTIRLGQAAKNSKALRDISIELQVIETLDGNYLVSDHIDFDVIINPKDRKIILYQKDQIDNEYVFDSQMRYVQFMQARGVVNRESVQGGSLYNTLEMTYPESHEGYNAFAIVLKTTEKFMDSEREYFEGARIAKSYPEEVADAEDAETTEYSPERQSEKKGSLGDNVSNDAVGGFLVHRIFESLQIEEE